jgi:hypothetical protein
MGEKSSRYKSYVADLKQRDRSEDWGVGARIILE